MDEVEQMEEEMQDMKEDSMEDDLEYNQELQEAYGYPTPEPKYNQHIFLHQAAFDSEDTVRTTFLTKEELGRPLFTVRFMLDIRTAAIKKTYDCLSTEERLNLDRIAEYFKEKIQNVTNSGMSNEGFAMNLNVTQKRDSVRKKVRDISGLKNQRRRVPQDAAA